MKSSKLLSSLWGNKLPRVLVANRGEIAIRISSALSELGAQSIGLYSEADAHSLHRFKFQESLKILPHYLNESPSAFWDVNSYLDVPAIISLAKKHNIQMIHPGYGFLSENEEFAQACKNEGITFIGPKPETIKLLGDKINARLLAKQVNVPVLPGLDAPISSVSEATSFIKEVGFPLIIKAVHGGGGKGIRVVHRLEEFEESFARCVSEAKRAFGNGEVFIEKFIDNPRHIEVQILGDSKGHLVHLFERECSIQRNHQKIIEIAPCPSLDPEVRLKITQCALKIAKHCDYINAGTVEFLLEPNSKTFYFIEVNPRLQVEHTITEEILGLDLVQLQILIASGATLEQLSLNQQKIQPNGYAIQCRIQADKGHVQEYKEPSGRGIRVDSCCYSGYSVSGLYDAVIAKLITHGPDFHASVMKALHALDSFVVEGIHTNIPFLKNILSHPKFLENQIGVRFLDLYRDDLASTKNNHSFISAVLPTSILQYLASTILNSVPNLQEFQALKNQFPDLSFPSEGFSSPLNENQSIVIQVSGGKSFEIIFLTIHSSPGQQNFIFSVNGTIRRITILKQQSHPSNIHNIDTNSQGTVISPVSGYVVDIRVQEGNYAESGTPLILLTEMKMEHSICAPISSNVVQYFVKKGDYVSRGQIVAILNEQTSNSNNSATRRVSAIGTHLLNQTGWLASLEALKKQKQLAYQLGGPKGIQRQKSQGKLTVRERISLLLDKDSFQEIGSLSGKATYNENNELETFTAANCVGGKGEIKKKPVIVVGDDFTIRGGHSDGGIWKKQPYIEQLGRELRIPVIRLLDGSSGGGSVASVLDMDFTYVPMLLGMEHQVPMLSEIPVISALLGPVVGLAAARAVLTHFSVMVEGKSQLFVAGPPIVEQATAEKLSKDQLGGSSIHGKNGSIDNLCKSEEEAFQQIRKFLSYMPQNAWNLPSRLLENQRVDPPSRKEEALLHIIPIKRKATYNMREIIHLVVDKDSFFEIGESWGTAIIVGLARLNGYVVGILGSDCRRDAGVLTALGAQKLRRHVDLCNTFHIPVVSFVDQPGFAIGLEAEKQSTIRYGGSLIAALYLASVPWFTVIVRKAFGVGAAALVDRGGMRVSWPSGDWGSLPFEGGIQAAFKRQMESSDNPQAFYDAMMKRFEAVRNPIRTATAFGIEEIIDPRDTRPLLCDWIHLAYLKQSSEQISPKKGFYRP